MSRAVLLALAAGVLAAVAIGELAGSRRGRAPAGHDRRLRRAVAILAALGRRIGILPAPGDLAARLAAAGAPLRLQPADLMAIKAGAALVGPLAALPFAAAAPGRLAPVLLVAGVTGGYVAPDLWLRRRTTRRVRVMGSEVADVLDLLRVCAQAGLPTARALAEVGARHGGALAAEVRAAAATIALGVHRQAALARLEAAAPLPAVASLVAAIRRSDRHGAPLAPALAALAADARAEQGRALTERAARAAPKIQLAVALLLVPAVMLLVGAAVLRAVGVA